MEKTAFLRKLAVDAVPNEHWGLPEKKLFPLHTASHIKLAQDMFPAADKDVAIRVELAGNIARRANELGVPLNTKIATLALKQLNPDFAAHIDLRKVDAMHLQDPELEQLKKTAMDHKDKPDVLVKVASAIQALDRATGIELRVSDPAEVVFGAHAELFARRAPQSHIVIDSEKIASMKGKFSDSTIKHLEAGRPIYDLPGGTREVVASFLRSNS